MALVGSETRATTFCRSKPGTMAGMTNFFNLGSTATRFRFIAVLEAFIWLGLLI